jgi:ABC-type arginine transport system permease subunit
MILNGFLFTIGVALAGVFLYVCLALLQAIGTVIEDKIINRYFYD